MTTRATRFGAAMLAGVAVCALASAPAFAQRGGPTFPAIRYSPNINLPFSQYASNIATLGRAYSHVPPYALGYNPYPQAVNYGPSFPTYAPSPPYGLPYGGAAISSVAASPYGAAYGSSPGYGGSPGYGVSPGYDGSNPYSSYADPYGGGLRGAAAAIDSQGRFEIDFQKARLMNQQVEQSKIDTRRRIYDEWLYERANTPTAVDILERTKKLELHRALIGPSVTEILSGAALNTILDDLLKKPTLGASGQLPPLDDSILKQVNVRPLGTAGNIGVLKAIKDGAPLNWPLPLQGTVFQDEVRRVNQQAAEAVKLAQNMGQVDPGTLNNLKDDIRKLRAKVSSPANELAPTQAIEANRFLNQLDDAVNALRQPDVANYFTERFSAKGKTVVDLVQYMKKTGLQFAPSVGGDEGAYTALYNYLVGYANGLQTQANPRE